MRYSSVITVGFCPAWDVTCRAAGIDWGQHSKVQQTAVPAGKALNVSKALAWMGEKSIAAGLWGQVDRASAVEALSAYKDHIDFRFTNAAGQTRQNITVIDTHHQREMHLRAVSPLATESSLDQLREDLKALLDAGSLVVFSGSMPEGDLQEDCLSIVREVWESGAEVAVDSSGEALARIVQLGAFSLLKPNMEELSQLFGRPVPNDASSIMVAARGLCDRGGMVLVSRGADGAMVVTRNQAIVCRVKPAEHKVLNTVACGDYLLGGFLAGGAKTELPIRLENAVKTATSRAWGLIETAAWQQVRSQIEVETTVLG